MQAVPRLPPVRQAVTVRVGVERIRRKIPQERRVADLGNDGRRGRSGSGRSQSGRVELEPVQGILRPSTQDLQRVVAAVEGVGIADHTDRWSRIKPVICLFLCRVVHPAIHGIGRGRPTPRAAIHAHPTDVLHGGIRGRVLVPYLEGVLPWQTDMEHVSQRKKGSGRDIRVGISDPPRIGVVLVAQVSGIVRLADPAAAS